MQYAVIGGGITGLTAAYRLLQKGNEICVLESTSELGGLAASFPLGSTYLEKTYHHLFLTDHECIGLLQELKIDHLLKWHRGSIGCYVDDTNFPLSNIIDFLLFKPLHWTERLRLGLIVAYLQSLRSGMRFSSVSASSWMQHAAGEKIYRLIWNPLLRAKFHDHSNEISMAWLWSRIATRAHSRRSILSPELLGYLQGGCHQIISALEEKLCRGGATIALNTPAKHLRIPEGNNGIEIVTEEKVFHADKVISTLPSPLFASTIENIPGVSRQYLDSLRSISYLGAVCVVLELNQSLSPYYWTNICMDDAPFVAFIEHTNLVGTKSYGGKHIYYLGAYVPHDHPFFCEPTGSIEETFLSFLGKIFPKFHREMVVSAKTFRFPNAQHVVDTHYANRMPSHSTPIRNVFLANFSQSFPEDRGINTAIHLANKVAAIASE